MRLFSITDLLRRAANATILTLAAGGWLAEAAGPAVPAGPALARWAFQPAVVTLDGVPAPPASMSVCGFRLVARAAGPQLAVMEPAAMLASLGPGEELAVAIPVQCAAGSASLSAEAARWKATRPKSAFRSAKRPGLSGCSPVGRCGWMRPAPAAVRRSSCA